MYRSNSSGSLRIESWRCSSVMSGCHVDDQRDPRCEPRCHTVLERVVEGEGPPLGPAARAVAHRIRSPAAREPQVERIRVFDRPQCGRRWVPPSITDTFSASHHRDHLGQRLEHARRQRRYVDVLLEPTRQVVHVELGPRPRRRDPSVSATPSRTSSPLAIFAITSSRIAWFACSTCTRQLPWSSRHGCALNSFTRCPGACIVAGARRRRPLAQRHRLLAVRPPAAQRADHVVVRAAGSLNPSCKRRARVAALPRTRDAQARATRPPAAAGATACEVAERCVDIALVRRWPNRWWPSADGWSGRARAPHGGHPRHRSGRSQI